MRRHFILTDEMFSRKVGGGVFCLRRWGYCSFARRVLSVTSRSNRENRGKSDIANELVFTAAELLDVEVTIPKTEQKDPEVLKKNGAFLGAVEVSSKSKVGHKNRRAKAKSKEKIAAAVCGTSVPHTSVQSVDADKFSSEGNLDAKKTQTSIQSQDNSIPNSLLDRGSITDSNSFTDFYQSILETYDAYSARTDGKYIVLIHVGSFYELYFDQADKYSGLLGLTLTKKNLKLGPISFSGFPDRMLDKYMDIIHKAGYKAVICNQVTDPVTNTISRPVDRIMTPGIIIDESCRDFHRNNYLMAFSLPEDLSSDIERKKVGIAWCDVNLGLFYILEVEFSQLLSSVTRINPSEILISDKADSNILLNGSILPELVELKSYCITNYHEKSKKKSLDDFLWRFSDNKRLVSTTLDAMSPKEKSATSLLLHYLEACLPNFKTSFQLPTRSLPKTLMQIDSRAAQDLELLETLQSRKRIGALSHLMDKTVTSPGARLLNTWLLAPSTNVKEIKRRHDLLGLFLKDPYFLDTLVQQLKKTADINRIIRRIDNARADRYEYLELASTIKVLDNIYSLVEQLHDKQAVKLIEPIFNEFKNSMKIHKLAKQIEDTIDPKVSYLKTNLNKLEGDLVREFWEIKETASPHLKKLRKEYDLQVSKSSTLKQELLEQFQREGYGGSLKLIKDMKTYDYVIELKSTSKVIGPMINTLNLQVKEKTKSVTKLSDSRWSEIGGQLIKLEYDILLEEAVIMNSLNSKISKLSRDLRKLSPIIEILDVIQSFANLTLQYNLSRPNVDDSTIFDVKNGRHLVVEEGLRNRIDVVNYTTNSCDIRSSQAWLITGPNMGGKSTFLRQNALIAILSQIGCYVPAEQAHIGIIDKIFTRVGSSDNIFKHQSTFMVEMNETATILREATEKSLVVIDELGRGTSTNEGVAIAHATLLHLLEVNKSKILFATHYGPELLTLLKSDKIMKQKIFFYKTSLHDSCEVEESNGGRNVKSIDQRLIFDHKLREGVSFHSHALKIAELAGFPRDVLKIAKDSYHKLIK